MINAGEIVIMRTPDYNRTGPDSYDHYIREELGLVVSCNSDGTVNVMKLQATHQSYSIDFTGKQPRSVRTLREFDFPTWGRRVERKTT